MKAGRKALSALLALALVLGALPARAAEEPEKKEDKCVCETLCTAEQKNEACPVCGPENADLKNCVKYVSPKEAPEKKETSEQKEADPEPEKKEDKCVCETLCTAETKNPDCPLCGPEGADLKKCAKYTDTTEEEATGNGTTGNKTTENETTEDKTTEDETTEEKPGPEPSPVEKVQAMIDALPGKDEITAANAGDVDAQLTAIDKAMDSYGFGDGEKALLDVTRYVDAAEALGALEDPGQKEKGPQRTDLPETYQECSWNGSVVTEDKRIPDGAIEINSENMPVTWGTAGQDSWYVVSGEVDIRSDITIQGNVHLILTDNCKLTVWRILVYNPSSLAIHAQSTDGSMGTLECEYYIGGGSLYSSETCGKIAIHGGNITAGTGISGKSPDITIFGGTIRVTGGDNEAGIGGSNRCSGGTINIYGGKITATGGKEAAGIGGGAMASGGVINIHGGTITANGGRRSAGIGGGLGKGGGTITITGGTITATAGGEFGAGAGIGGSDSGVGDYERDGGTITITGSNTHITATGYNGNDIGNAGNRGATITIGPEVPTPLKNDGTPAKIGASHTKASTNWSSNDSQHWHPCEVSGCNQNHKFDTANHTWDAGVITETGGISYTCTICQKTKTADLSSISVATQPETTYASGEALDLSGLKITATYSDGSTREITYGENSGMTFAIDGTAISHGDSLSHSAHNGKTITVTYFTKTATTNALTVTKAAQTGFSITDKPTDPITYGQTFTLGTSGGSGNGAVTWAVTSGGEYATVNNSGLVTVTGVGSVTITATKAGDEHYNEATATYTFTSVKAAPTCTPPTDLTATFGQTLADVALTNPAGNTAGTWTWEAAGTTAVGDKGTRTHKATFTPNDTDHYNTVSGIDVTVAVTALRLPAPKNPRWENATAKWDAVTNASGYSVQLQKDGRNLGAPVPVEGRTECTFVFRDPQAGSYTFQVTALGEGNYSKSSASEVSDKRTYYAVTFEPNGGSDVPGQVVLSGGKAARPTDPKRTGYTFKGWYDNKDLTGEAWDFDKDTVSGATTLYAAWEINKYTVTYKANGKVISTQQVEHGKNAKPPAVPYKSGYRGKWDGDGKNITADTVITAKYTQTFKGWWTNPKTGDAIRVVFVVLAASAAGLCAMGGYALWKKRRK